MNTLYLKKPEEIKIYLNPFHSKIMRIMKKEYRPMTVKEIADEMGLSPAKVYYHVKKLESIGVLSVRYTKVINGIVAKYYDFAADSIALSIPDGEEGSDILRSKVMAEYGGYFDEAKQQFFDLYNTDEPMDEKGVYITREDSFSVDPKRMGEMHDELKQVLKKYRSSKKEAVPYSLFLFMIQNKGEKEPSPQKKG